MAGELENQPHEEILFQCPECGLHYTDERIAQECEAFCKEHNACSLDITKHSAEVSN